MSREILDSWQAYRSAAEQLLATAQQRLYIYDEDLKALPLNAISDLDHLRRLCAGPSDHPLRFAIRQAEHFRNHCPRLLDMLRHWEHRAAVHQTGVSIAHLRDNILLQDEGNALIRLDKDHPRSVLILDDPEAVAPYARRFDEIWLESNVSLLAGTTGL